MRVFALLLAAASLCAQPPTDRLGRGTPKSSFLNFLRVAHQGNFQQAALYMEFAPGQAEPQRRELARKLLFILDRGYVGNLDGLSTKPEGSSDDRLPPDRELVGNISGLEQSGAVELVRVTEAGQRVWLISQSTIDQVPTLFPEFGFPWIEDRLPRPLLDLHLFSMPLWVLIAIAGALPLSLGLAWAIGWLILKITPAPWTTATRPSLPVVTFIGLLFHSAVSRALGLALVYRIWYTRVIIVLFIVLAVWIIFGVIATLDKRAREYLLKNNLSATQAGLQLGRRILQILVILIAVLFGLRSLGYDITAALAGLGIGGLAIAFAAQKTLENVFGGFSLLSDQSIRVGDPCLFGATAATVEEIGLRATRFRTLQRSVLYIPNGQLASMNIENLGQRDKILFRHTIGVKYGLKRDEMHELLADLRDLLNKDSRLDPDGRRVHFLKFGPYSLDIELFAFVLTNDWKTFLDIQEELLSEIMRIVEKHDTDFAFPSQTLYVEQGQLPFAPEMKGPQAAPAHDASGAPAPPPAP
jgi:MscS family membrane protein